MIRDEIGVLVVEDVNTMRIQIRDLLRQFGFKKILLYESVAEAKQILDIESVHLILCDWHMEPEGGLDLLKYVRSSKHKDAAFIMVTADSTKERVIEAIQSGVDDYLLKPLTIAQIQNKIYGALLKRKVL